MKYSEEEEESAAPVWEEEGAAPVLEEEGDSKVLGGRGGGCSLVPRPSRGRSRREREGLVLRMRQRPPDFEGLAYARMRLRRVLHLPWRKREI